MARRSKSLKFLFITDPLANFDPESETTLFMMNEAQRCGHQIYATTPPQLSSRGRNVYALSQKLKIQGIGKKDWCKILSTQNQELKSFDAIFLRKDPPFDLDYLHHLYLLDLISKDVYMMNHPRGILAANEKLLPLTLNTKIPETLISANIVELLNFVQQHPKGVIIKPIGSSGGRGVFLLRGPKADNLKVILETATKGFTHHVVAQTFIPEVKKGDKRILLLGQEILGAFLRKPASGEHRANLHAGGTLHKTTLSASDHKIVLELKPTLNKLGLDFVGLDIIGNYLIEINVTSPMGLREINKTSDRSSEKQLLDFIEKRVI